MTVVKMSDELVEKIAAESPKNKELRKSLELKRDSLLKGVEACCNILPGIDTGKLFAKFLLKALLTLRLDYEEEDA
jgi:hypothetical protein